MIDHTHRYSTPQPLPSCPLIPDPLTVAFFYINTPEKARLFCKVDKKLKKGERERGSEEIKKERERENVYDSEKWKRLKLHIVTR